MRAPKRAPSPSARSICAPRCAWFTTRSVESAGDEALDLPLDERAAAGAQQRLGRGVGERAQALAAPGREDDRARRIKT